MILSVRVETKLEILAVHCFPCSRPTLQKIKEVYTTTNFIYNCFFFSFMEKLVFRTAWQIINYYCGDAIPQNKVQIITSKYSLILLEIFYSHDKLTIFTAVHLIMLVMLAQLLHQQLG